MGDQVKQNKEKEKSHSVTSCLAAFSYPSDSQWLQIFFTFRVQSLNQYPSAST